MNEREGKLDRNFFTYRFKQKEHDDSDYVYIQYKFGKACDVPFGRKGGKQDVLLTPYCSTTLKDMTTQFLHILGVANEFNRKDRDAYVQIVWKNIDPGIFSNISFSDTLSFVFFYF